ncbi:hypothetical protein D3C75_839610 [compost metagenome]
MQGAGRADLYTLFRFDAWGTDTHTRTGCGADNFNSVGLHRTKQAGVDPPFGGGSGDRLDDLPIGMVHPISSNGQVEVTLGNELPARINLRR